MVDEWLVNGRSMVDQWLMNGCSMVVASRRHREVQPAHGEPASTGPRGADIAAERINAERCCRGWTPNGALAARPARPALPQIRSEHKERPEMRMTYACHRSRALHLLNPPGRTKHRTQAAPEGTPGYSALCPSQEGKDRRPRTRRHPKVPLVTRPSALVQAVTRKRVTAVDPTLAVR